MVRPRVAALALLTLLSAQAAQAQSFSFTGLVTGQVGIAAGKDVRDPSMAPGVSVAVVDGDGYGSEVDISHTSDFDDRFFGGSSITSGMLSFGYIRPHSTLRPYVVVGAGLIRVRIARFEQQSTFGRTELGWNLGGGAHYMVNELFGIRGDVRYLRHFTRHSDLPLSGNGVLDFWRISVGATAAWPIS